MCIVLKFLLIISVFNKSTLLFIVTTCMYINLKKRAQATGPVQKEYIFKGGQ
jgi:hypothetical protein